MGDAGDRISDLPDELLLAILVRLRSARAAARTSVLSRRWRRLWPHLPELFLHDGRDAPAPRPPLASFLDSVDAALAAYSAPALRGLIIALFADYGLGVPTGRVAPWLRFAAERVVGRLFLKVPLRSYRSRLEPRVGGEEAVQVLELPACARVTTIDLSLEVAWRLRLPSAGLFRRLTDLSIFAASSSVYGSELTALVCTQCPCLRDLRLDFGLVDVSDVSIRSDSLQSLRFCVWNTRQLEVFAPRLEKLAIYMYPEAVGEARISAPKLAEVAWNCSTYDPYHHQFHNVGRHLQLLSLPIDHKSTVASLLQQFDEVDELKLTIDLRQGIACYQRFLNETSNMPKCKTLNVTSAWKHHGLALGLLHLLMSCNSTKVSIWLLNTFKLRYVCPTSCPCILEQNRKLDISLNLLEEVEITSGAISDEVLEFVEQLSRCNATILKKVVMNLKSIHSLPLTLEKEVREKMLRMFQPNIVVEFYMFSDGRWVQLD